MTKFLGFMTKSEVLWQIWGFMTKSEIKLRICCTFLSPYGLEPFFDRHRALFWSTKPSKIDKIREIDYFFMKIREIDYFSWKSENLTENQSIWLKSRVFDWNPGYLAAPLVPHCMATVDPLYCHCEPHCNGHGAVPGGVPRCSTRQRHHHPITHYPGTTTRTPPLAPC